MSEPRLYLPTADPTVLLEDRPDIPPDLTARRTYIAPLPTAAGEGSLSRFGVPGQAPVQGDTLLNRSWVSSFNTALEAILPGSPGTRIHVYSLLVRCSPAGTSTLTIQDDGGSVYIPSGLVVVPAGLLALAWQPGLTFPESRSARIMLTAAGIGNQTILAVEADRF